MNPTLHMKQDIHAHSYSMQTEKAELIKRGLNKSSGIFSYRNAAGWHQQELSLGTCWYLGDNNLSRWGEFNRIESQTLSPVVVSIKVCM